MVARERHVRQFSLSIYHTASILGNRGAVFENRSYALIAIVRFDRKRAFETIDRRAIGGDPEKLSTPDPLDVSDFRADLSATQS